jgi:hypothetical protein
MPGVDAQRSHRSTTTLRATPQVKSRMRVAYGIGKGVVVRSDGGFALLHPSARVSSFDAQGKLEYSVKLAAEPGSAPVLTSAGRIAFVQKGELLILSAAGRISRVQLSWDVALTARSILSTRDGGVLLATSNALFKVSAFGELEWRRATPEPMLELLEAGTTSLALSEAGVVYSLGPQGKPSRLGELGGAASAAVLSADGASLLARAGPRRLANFDVTSRRLRSVAKEAAVDLDGPVLFGFDGQALAFTSDGLLVRYRPDGSESQRVAVEPGARKAPAHNLALLLGDAGLLVAHAASDIALVSPTGEVSRVAGSGCPDPVGIYPAGPRAVLVACRAGNMLRIE